ncbi:protein serine/threonine phosphatase [Xylanimonas cellulosilytica DSM 15894]|uniref:Protein serine/threonine phosphatase n=1 Tax=Xylanimonas cellulosilytica (strain DSM 15894 / JCM 12276 / CECT 5975 / KCTC 9989 / LMG 20990 / NBRC 107835 / XIL07) TaxID=446471 RepID=D1BW25_XYLCX|nr:protein phosphatase 2C domain-containing protein [Xylanimonas cellulosilytica]ACZ29528.1 protein serine/threonine phosphatase [Xylanimonas cellulosilytica DSM 15894]
MNTLNGLESVVLRWGSATHTGARRALNEDHFLADGFAFLVADGMGGHEAGDVASSTAIDALLPLTAGIQDALEGDGAAGVERLLATAHGRVAAIVTEPGKEAGTTVSGVVLAEQDGVPYWLVVNLGDSRTYLLTDGELEQVSVDHSEVQELFDAGVITARETRTHPRRHVVTRALGPGAPCAADFWYLPVGEHDRVLVCSDGLSGELDDERIAQVLLEVPDAQSAADRLVHEALAAGGRDNITVVVVDVTAAGDDDGKRTAPRGVLVLTDEDTRPRADLVTEGER